MKLRVKLKIILLLLVIYIPLLFAQQPSLEWVKRYPDSVNSSGIGKVSKIDNSGNVIVSGLITINSVWHYGTIKYSSNGAQYWVRLFPGPGGRQPRSMAIDNYNNIYVTGYSYQPGHNFDYLTIKYDSGGNEKWVHHYNGEANGLDDAYSIAADNDNNIYVTGLKSYGGISFVYCTIKYDTDGNIIWQRDYGPPSQGTEPHAISVDYNSNIYITGRHGINAATISYDSSGNLRWVQNYPNATANDIALDNEANVFVTGISDIAYVKQFFTIKYSTAGELLWEKNYLNCDTIGCFNEVKDISVDNSNNVIITGVSGNSQMGDNVIVTIKYSNNGDSIWGSIKDRDTISPYLGFGAVSLDSGNNIYIFTRTWDTTGYYNGGRYFTFKYDSTGNLKWTVMYGGSYLFDAFANSIVVDNSSNIYITGGLSVDGYTNQTDVVTLKYSQPIGLIQISEIIPSEYSLEQNYPNPFNSVTNFVFHLKTLSKVKLLIYDLTGKEIEIVTEEFLNAGTYKAEWDAGNFASGVYFYSLIVNEYKETKKMILIK